MSDRFVFQVPEVELPPDRCNTSIYDENSSQPEAGLQAIIGRFANEGVTVNVQLVTSMADEGYDGSEPTEVKAAGDNYTEAIIEGCGWDTSNSITVVVSGEPRYFNIALSGVQADFDDANATDVDRVTSGFREDLQDGGPDSYQEDAAEALVDLYDEQFQAEAPVAPNLPQPEVATPPKESKDINIPIAPIAGAGIGIAAIAGTAAQIIRRRSIKEIRNGFNSLLHGHKDLVSTAVLTGETEGALTKILPEDDAPKLRELEQAVHVDHASWSTLVENTEAELKRINRKFWPNKQQATYTTDVYAEESDQYIQLVDEYLKENQKVQEKIDTVDDVASAAKTIASAANEQISALKTANEDRPAYDVTTLEADIQKVQAIITQADNLRDRNYIDKPYDLYETAEAQMATILEFASNLPEFHAKLNQDTKVGQQEQANRTDALAKLEEVVAEIKEEFDESCWADIESGLQDAKDRHAKIGQKLAGIGDSAAEFNVAKLVEDRASLGQIASLDEAFEDTETMIYAHQKLLSELRDNLPEAIDALLQDQAEAEEFINEYAADIEDPTEEEVLSLRSQIEKIQAKVIAEKPEYLTLETTRQNLTNALTRAREKAEAERQEMIDLREDIETLAVQVQSAISTAEHYEASHSDVDLATEADIAALDLPEQPRQRHRAALRAAKRLYEEALQDAEEALSDAKSDVRREEEARERARERARQAEQARQAAASARSSFNSGSFGGGSRTSHNSGSF